MRDDCFSHLKAPWLIPSVPGARRAKGRRVGDNALADVISSSIFFVAGFNGVTNTCLEAAADTTGPAKRASKLKPNSRF